MNQFIQIPNLTEHNFSTFLSSVSSITYPVFKSFGTEDFSFPCVLVKAGKFNQMEPNTGVFQGSVAVSVISQIDDVESPLSTHDLQVSMVYDALELPDFTEYFNENGTVWFMSLESIEQEKQDRSLITILEYSITCQNMTL